MYALLRSFKHLTYTSVEKYSGTYSELIQQGYVEVFSGTLFQCEKRQAVLMKFVFEPEGA